MTMTFHPEADLQGSIARLFVHPVKSCAGTEVREALLTEAGLESDRAWMVVDAQGVFLTQRTLPRMALVRPEVAGDALVLRAPGMPELRLDANAAAAPATVTVWNDTVPAWDAGEAAARWFSTFLGQPCRLVRCDPAHRRLSRRDWTGGLEAPNRFSDGFPVLVASEASLDDLNHRLQAAGHAAVGMERMRPNVVLAGVQAHDEDRVDRVRIGTGAGLEVQLQLVKPCARCPIPDIDPATAQSHPAVGDTLRTYRQDKRLDGAITFGMNAIVRQGAGQVLRVGQPMAADLRFD
jgi:uncharacterized protein YcbX